MNRAWTIRIDDLTGDAIKALLEQHFSGMLSNSPPGSCHFLDFAALRSHEVTFWSIWDDKMLAGCGALKQIDPKHGEIKSMRVADAFRGQGAGYAMLAHIIAEARRRGYTRLSLETGSGAAFHDAAKLYERSGFKLCAPFADYKPDPFSRFMTIEL